MPVLFQFLENGDYFSKKLLCHSVPRWQLWHFPHWRKVLSATFKKGWQLVADATQGLMANGRVCGTYVHSRIVYQAIARVAGGGKCQQMPEWRIFLLVPCRFICEEGVIEG